MNCVRLRGASKALLFCALAVAAGLASCESPPEAPPPPPVVAGAPAPPPVLLPREVIEAASVYEAYVQRASALEAGFTGSESVASSLKTAETYESDQFQRGETAYGAIVALQDPTFVQTLRVYAFDAGLRGQIASNVLIDPAYVTHFRGSDSAAGLVIAALSEQGQKLMAVGARIHQAAYDVQHQPWSKAEVQDRAARLALAKSLSSEQQIAIREDALRLSQAVSGDQPLGLAAPPAAPPYTPLVARSLAVAAMAAMGEGGEEYADQIKTLLAEAAEGSCLHMAKLNLYQCLAVSKPYYEDVFCLGQHAVSDTGQCIMRAAQITAPPVAVVQPAPPADAKTQKPRRKKKPAEASQG